MEKPFKHFWQLLCEVTMVPEVIELPVNLVTSLHVIFLLTRWYQRDKIHGKLFLLLVNISTILSLIMLAVLQTQKGMMKWSLIGRQRT